MKNRKKIIIATLAMVAAALLISSVAAMPVGYSSNNAYGGMMGGYSHASTSTPTQYHQPSTFGRGMMGWFGSGFGQMMRWLRL